MSKKAYTGINIQYPISRLILEGEKSIETRFYPIPKRYLGQEMLLIETPGRLEKFKARVIGKVTFEKCFQYQTEEEFYRDKKKHHVGVGSPWQWQENRKKWGWVISSVTKFEKNFDAPKCKGILYTKNIFLPSSYV